MDGFVAPEWEGGVRARSARPASPSADASATRIRRAVEDDLEVLASLFRPALEPYRGREGDWIVDAYLAELMNVHGRMDVGETYVATSEGRLVGSIVFYPDVALEGWSTFPAGWAGFRALVVDPVFRGAGIGRTLVELCLARGRDVGAPVLGIHTVPLLDDAVKLYERVGFVRCPEFDMLAADVFPTAGADDMRALAFRVGLARHELAG